MIVALISMIIVLLEIISLPLRLNNYPLFIYGAAALLGGAISIYFLVKLKRPRLSVLGFVIVSIFLFVFMGQYGYLATLLFIITAILIWYIKAVVRKIR